MRLQGKTALVTGAGRGLGRAVALLLAGEGAAIGVASLEPQEVERTVAEIEAAGGQALGIPVDVSQEAQAQQAVEAVEQRFGGLDILVNNAGIYAEIDFLTAPQAEWDAVMRVNFYGCLYFARASARAMVRRGQGGRIVNVSSIMGRRGSDHSTSYSIAKSAIDQLTRCLAVELAPHGILVNGVAPGYMDTQMSFVNGVKSHDRPEFQENYVRQRRIPLARACQPEEVAQAVLFLTLPENSYVTGQILAVDGGLTLRF